MAGQVVDLISSSPSPELRPKQRAGNTVTKASTSTSTRLAPPPAVDLDGLTEEFDTTGEIDELVLQYQRSANPPGSALKHSAVPGVEILSDDFQSTGDLAEPILVESNGNGSKRRRISPSAGPLSSPRRISKGKAPALADDFDFSDPFASSPPPPTADIVKSKDTSRAESNTSEVYTAYMSSTKDHANPTIGPSVQSKPMPRISDIPQLSDPFTSSQDSVGLGKAGNAGTAAFGAGLSGRSNHVSSKAGSCLPITGEVFADPFTSSPVREAIPSAQGVMDLTQDDLGGVAKSPVTRSKPNPKRIPTRAPSSDPFASSPQRPSHGNKKNPDLQIASSPPPVTTTSHARRQQWDPISSSAPEAPVINIDSDSDSANDSEDFPDMDSLIRNPSQRPRSQMSRSRSDVLPKAKAGNRTSKGKPPAKTADERARDKARREADKEREKERKKEDRQRIKEAKTREKERAAALAEVNKMRTDKKVSTPEMIVDVPSSLDGGTRVQLDTLLEGLGVEFTMWDTSDVVFKWRRKVTSKWDDDLGHWVPIPHRIMHEKHVAVVMRAQEFVDLALDSDRGVRSHVVSLEEKFSGNQIIYIIEGMTPWMRKNRNLRNRQFASGVRSETTGGGRRRAALQEYVDEDLVEDALLELQVMHDVLIHHTTIPLETAQWITVLTQHISTIPYKQQKSEAQGAGFCMESGQVKTGEDNKDTYVRLLQEIARVTQPIAYGVTIEFPSVTQLVNGLSDEGPMRLSDVRKTVNREGTLGDKTIGQAVSKRIHKVFTGRDEKSTDV